MCLTKFITVISLGFFFPLSISSSLHRFFFIYRRHFPYLAVFLGGFVFDAIYKIWLCFSGKFLRSWLDVKASWISISLVKLCTTIRAGIMNFREWDHIIQILLDYLQDCKEFSIGVLQFSFYLGWFIVQSFLSSRLGLCSRCSPCWFSWSWWKKLV